MRVSDSHVAFRCCVPDSGLANRMAAVAAVPDTLSRCELYSDVHIKGKRLKDAKRRPAATMASRNGTCDALF